MRYLILADIHANIDVLEAIHESYDPILCLGDLVDYGPAPQEAVRWIRDSGAICICGNHDAAMPTPIPGNGAFDQRRSIFTMREREGNIV